MSITAGRSRSRSRGHGRSLTQLSASIAATEATLAYALRGNVSSVSVSFIFLMSQI